MKVAMPTFGDRVSPRFDCATSFLVITVDNGEISERRQLNSMDWAPHERVNHLVALRVDAVVCGGIDRWSAESLRSVGITLYGWVSGRIEEILNSLVRGELDADVMPVAGACCGVAASGRRVSGRAAFGCPPMDAEHRGRGCRHRHGQHDGSDSPSG